MTALDMHAGAYAVAKHLLEQDDLPISLMLPANEAYFTLPQADTYTWSRDTATAALLASRSMPDDADMSNIEEACGRNSFWWFEEALPLAGMEADEGCHDGLDASHIAALSIAVNEDHSWSVVRYRWLNNQFGQHLTPLAVLVVPKRATLRAVMEDVKGNIGHDDKRAMWRAHQVLRFVAAACAWLRQKIVTTSTGHIERHRSKQLQRDLGFRPQSDVKIIQLRRSEARHAVTVDGVAVDWSCRWIVNGHWRNQPYGNGEHKLIYIEPYVKGPEDKPLRAPSPVVYQVSR